MRIYPKQLKLVLEAERIYPYDFNVLNHGDLWSNNIMFQYDKDGRITEVYFVDFQVCKWGSPVQDLQYLLVSSCNNDIKVREFDYFIKYYHDELVKNLKLLNYPKEPPKLVDLQVQALKRGYTGNTLRINASIFFNVFIFRREYYSDDCSNGRART